MATTQFVEPGTDATQDFSFFAGHDASVTSDTTQFHAGGRSMKCANTGTGSGAFTADGVALPAGTLQSAWYYLSTNAPASVCLLMAVETSGNGSMVLGLGMNTNGTLRFGGRGTTQTNGTTVLPANTWVRLSWSYVITSVSVWSCKVYINGTLELNLTQTLGNLGLATPTCATFGIGNSSQNGFNSPPTMNVWVDSIYMDNRTDLTDCGAVDVTAKRPFSNGTTNGFTTQIGSGGSGYGSGHTPQVNERPLSVTNGWSMIGAGSAVTEEYSIEGLSVGDVDLTGATIVDYMGWVYASALASETASIIVGGTSSNISLTSTNTMFKKAKGSTTYPAGGTDIGIVTTTALTTVSLYESGIMVAYTPAVAPATTIGATFMMMGIG